MSRLFDTIGLTRILGRARHVTGIMKAITKNVMRVVIGFIALFLLASLIREGLSARYAHMPRVS